MLRRKLSLAILLAMLTPAAWTQELADFLQPKSNYLQLQGSFNQLKTIAILPQPLASKGSFVFKREGYLEWIVSHPVAGRIEVFPDKIIQYDQAQQGQELSVNRYPFVRVLSDVFFGVLSGNVAILNSHFDMSSSGNNDAWEARLIPRDDAFKQAVESISLYGGVDIERFVLHEISGDKTEILFQQLTYQ